MAIENEAKQPASLILFHDFFPANNIYTKLLLTRNYKVRFNENTSQYKITT